LLSFILTICERKNLLKEIDTAPLTFIDESLTEELYQNIINQSKNPNNKNFIAEFNRLNENREKKILDAKGSSLDISAGSALLEGTKHVGSINPSVNGAITSKSLY